MYKKWKNSSGAVTAWYKTSPKGTVSDVTRYGCSPKAGSTRISAGRAGGNRYMLNMIPATAEAAMKTIGCSFFRGVYLLQMNTAAQRMIAGQ